MKHILITAGLALCPAATLMAQDIYVGYINGNNASVGEYGLDGSTVNASLISELPGTYGTAMGLAVSGNNLFVAGFNNYTIGEYNAISGAAINASLISGLDAPFGIAVSGNDLFVSDEDDGTVGEYNATTGAAINASLISGLDAPFGIAVSGNDLFVSDEDDGTVGEYNATTGAAINASLISGLNGAYGIAIGPVPEPSTIALAGLGTAALWLWRRRAIART